MVMLTQDAQDLVAHSKKIRADVEAPWKQIMELAGEIQKKIARAIVESAWSKAVTEELPIIASKTAACRVESAKFC